MAAFPTVLILLVLVGVIVGLIALGLRKGASGVKIMLLGINLTLFGGIIAVDPNSNLGGIEYLIAFLGLLISTIGLGKRD
jgi:hypothetical protein